MRKFFLPTVCILAALLTLGGCWRVQLVPPALLNKSHRAPRVKAVKRQAAPRGTLYPGGVVLRKLDLRSKASQPSKAAQRSFRHALSKTLDVNFPRTDKSRPPLRVDIRYRYRTQPRRWLALDILHTVTLGFVFVSPEKGEANVDVTLVVTAPRNSTGGARTYRATLRVRAPYKSFFSPWYDRSTRQKYLNQAHTVAFRKIVTHLQWWLTRGMAARRKPAASPRRPRRSPPPKAAQKSTLPKGPKAPARRLAWYDLKLHVEGRSKTVNRRWKGDTIVGSERVKVRERRTAFGKLLKLLGGLSVGYSYGSVWAQSKVRDENGRRYSIASGRGTTHSVGVSLFRPPQHSGIYFSPTVGFLWERFSIQDVAGTVSQNEENSATDIPAIATDPDQPGRPVIDLGAAWRYRLIMTSLYLGLRAGVVGVWGRKTQFFVGLEGGANLVEWRWMDVMWDSYRDKSHAFAGAGSFAGRLMIGLTIRPWHLTIFIQGAYEYFREFAYPEPVPFRGKPTYEPTVDVWQRPVQTAEGLSLHALRLFCGVAVIY